MPLIRPVILSGGSGTRLWPLSTGEQPKQFAPLMAGATLFERTITRIAAIPDVGPPIVVTGSHQLELVEQSAERAGVSLGSVIVESEGRNTAPAAFAAALVCEPDETLVILPSDHLIRDQKAFGGAVAHAVELALDGYIVTFGVVPTAAETGYGYIETGEELASSGEAYRVIRFKEKPSAPEAERLVADGSHLWNSGMFVVNAGLLISEGERHCPELLSGVRSAIVEPVDGVVELGGAFSKVDKISLDHAVMEKTERAAVVPVEVGWSDVGSFEALWALDEKDERGNAVSGDVILSDVSHSIVRASSRRVAVSGVTGLVVIETPDAVLVIPRSMAQEVRLLAEEVDRD